MKTKQEILGQLRQILDTLKEEKVPAGLLQDVAEDLELLSRDVKDLGDEVEDTPDPVFDASSSPSEALGYCHRGCHAWRPKLGSEVGYCSIAGETVRSEEVCRPWARDLLKQLAKLKTESLGD